MTTEQAGRLTEKQIVQQARLGDEQAARLYEIHKPRVLAVCVRITREKTEAEDCVQEAFLQCFLQLSTFRGGSALSTWLYRLTVNVVLLQLRAKHLKFLPLEASGASQDSSQRRSRMHVPRRICAYKERSIESQSIELWESFLRATELFFCCMTWRARPTARLLASWAVRSGTRSHNCIRRDTDYDSFCDHHSHGLPARAALAVCPSPLHPCPRPFRSEDQSEVATPVWYSLDRIRCAVGQVNAGIRRISAPTKSGLRLLPAVLGIPRILSRKRRPLPSVPPASSDRPDAD
jgi:RNA polymerase sigma factor (sigma-70 family)